jgi:Asp-tRNA(Asn)/Glu-tRNA(Gln) amidotransferase A subunit family amidase
LRINTSPPEPPTAETDAWATAQDVRAGRTTAVTAVTDALDRITARDADVNACTVVLRATALAAARRVDEGAITGPLAGVPITVKDHVWLEGAPATNGSRALAGFVAPADAVCVARLRAAGAVVVAKTNNPEFCYRGVTDNELYGLTRNPRDLSRTAGGSSGGAAASVAAGMVPLAIGTDGGGSIRIPSAFCGTAGLKPTFGLVPKLPGFRGWPSLSVTGPIAASVRDLALALSVMAGPSALDDLSFPYPGGYLDAVATPSWSGLRVAASIDLGFAAVDDDVLAAFRGLLDRLTEVVVTEDHPEPSDPCALWDAIALPEGYASEGPLLATAADRVGADAAAIVRAGAKVTAQQYLDAQARRGRLYRRWADFFDHYDVLLTPSMPVTAFETGRWAPSSVAGKPVPDSFDAWCALVLPANLFGLPAASVPIGTGAGGLPVGVQVIGARGQDATVLRVAALIESCSTTGGP